MSTGLEEATGRILEELEKTSAAREVGLANSRKVTRLAANAIRALHRRDFTKAHSLLEEASVLLEQASQVLAPYPRVLWSGFLHDAQKEYAEACIYQAVVAAHPIPDHEELKIPGVAWLHGVAETIGELRRAVLDWLREGHSHEAEKFFQVMEKMYEILLQVDFPDSMTAGLRRATDAGRAILERTRADLSLTIVQSRLEAALARSVQAFSS